MCAKEHAGWLAHVLGVSEPVQCGLVRVPACARQRAPAELPAHHHSSHTAMINLHARNLDDHGRSTLHKYAREKSEKLRVSLKRAREQDAE